MWRTIARPLMPTPTPSTPLEKLPNRRDWRILTFAITEACANVPVPLSTDTPIESPTCTVTASSDVAGADMFTTITRPATVGAGERITTSRASRVSPTTRTPGLATLSRSTYMPGHTVTV